MGLWLRIRCECLLSGLVLEKGIFELTVYLCSGSGEWNHWGYGGMFMVVGALLTGILD